MLLNHKSLPPLGETTFHIQVISGMVFWVVNYAVSTVDLCVHRGWAWWKRWRLFPPWPPFMWNWVPNFMWHAYI